MKHVVNTILEYIAIGIIALFIAPLVILGLLISCVGHLVVIWPVKGIMYLFDRDSYNRNFRESLEKEYNDPNLL